MEGQTSDRNWRYLRSMLSTPGPFTSPFAAIDRDTIHTLSNAKILIIGAGGLGCEMVKNLAVTGFRDIHIIDMDTIDISNLNRQFLFTDSDVGQPKAEVAARAVMRRVPTARVTPHTCRVQDKPGSFYARFDLLICGLDNMEARRWVNATVVGLARPGRLDTITPLIDGGTEGFSGQVKVVIPTVTSCIECQMDMYAPRPEVPLCTLAAVPRQPEHCIEWAQLIAWPRERAAADPAAGPDLDSAADIDWLFRRAAERAAEFGIAGVTRALTRGVLKHIIPAVAATNATIAAACCSEALKLVTAIAPCLGDLSADQAPTYMMYIGDDGTYSYTFRPDKKPDCPVCGNLAADLPCRPDQTLRSWLEAFESREHLKIVPQSATSGTAPIYFKTPPALEEQTRKNLDRRMDELFANGEEVALLDEISAITFKFRLLFQLAPAEESL